MISPKELVREFIESLNKNHSNIFKIEDVGECTVYDWSAEPKKVPLAILNYGSWIFRLRWEYRLAESEDLYTADIWLVQLDSHPHAEFRILIAANGDDVRCFSDYNKELFVKHMNELIRCEIKQSKVFEGK